MSKEIFSPLRCFSNTVGSSQVWFATVPHPDPLRRVLGTGERSENWYLCGLEVLVYYGYLLMCVPFLLGSTMLVVERVCMHFPSIYQFILMGKCRNMLRVMGGGSWFTDRHSSCKKNKKMSASGHSRARALIPTGHWLVHG